MSKKSFIDSVKVKNPCTEDWDEMHGNDRIRFCSHCSKHVNNLSEMTRKEAMRLVRKSNGSLCVRYVQNPATRQPMFAEQLLQITRRTPAFAAGVMTASIALSGGAYAQGGTSSPNSFVIDGQEVENVLKGIKPEGSNSGRITGTVTDPNGAVIPQALVSLTNEDTSEYRFTTASMEGYYEFTDLVDGKYKLKIEAGGFEVREISSIMIADGSSERRDSQLDLQQVAAVVQVGGDAGGWTTTLGVVMTVTSVERKALVVAVEDEDLENVKARVGMGARVNVKDKGRDGITPLHAAIEVGNMEITQFLLDHGARVNARDSLKRTPLMMMDYDAKPQLLQLLLNYGARLNLVDKQKNTILMHFVDYHDNKEIVDMLVRYGLPVNAVNKEGKTALMIAARNDNSKSVQALLEGGADVSIATQMGETAWSLTTDADIKAMLERYGAGPTRMPGTEAAKTVGLQ